MKGVNYMLQDLNKLSELDRNELEYLLCFIVGAVKSGLENDETTAEVIAKQINKVINQERGE